MKRVEVLDIFKSDLDCYYTNALLFDDDKYLGHIIEGCEVKYINDISTLTNQKIEEVIEDYILSNFDSYLKLPKISKCSKLLQDIYKTVATTDTCMCGISEDEWNNYYTEYNDKDIKMLETEIEKYKLKDVLSIEEYGYKIFAFGDLQTKFIFDINLEKELSL